MFHRLMTPVAVLVLSLQTFSRADDWPQWLGSNRDSVWRETGIVEKFPDAGLPVKWRVPISGGYSGPAVADGRVYVTDYVRETGEPVNNPGARPPLTGQECVLCLDARDGTQLWKHAYSCAYRISYPAGPRATPAVADGKVYTLGAEGNLFCLDAKSGKVVWSKELKREYQVETPIWGFCGHPLVDGRKLICLVGGEGSVAVAFDNETGKELWRALSAAEPGYCPPTLIEAGGKRQLIIWHPESINGLDPESGTVYWSVPLKPGYGMSIAAPRKSGDYLFASGIGNVGALLKLDRDKPHAEVAWTGTGNTAVYCSNSTPFIEQGTIYGVCCNQGQLRGVELENGKRLWETFAPTTGERRAGHGTAFLVKQGDRFFLFNESGDLILARLSPKGYEEISRFHVLEPTGEAFGRNVVWTHPAFANQCVYVRNDKELVCVSLTIP